MIVHISVSQKAQLTGNCRRSCAAAGLTRRTAHASSASRAVCRYQPPRGFELQRLLVSDSSGGIHVLLLRKPKIHVAVGTTRHHCCVRHVSAGAPFISLLLLSTASMRRRFAAHYLRLALPPDAANRHPSRRCSLLIAEDSRHSFGPCPAAFRSVSHG